MSTATINQTFQVNAPGYLYLLEAPATAPAGATGTYAQQVDGYYSMFFTSGHNKQGIKSGVSPFANLTSTGLSAKVVGEPLKWTDNFGLESTPVLKSTKLEGEFTLMDADAAHMVTALSVATASITTIAGATGTPGQTYVPMGSNSKLTSYTACFVYDSPEASGEVNSVLLPHVKISPDFDISLSADKLIELKVKFFAQPEAFLKDPETNRPVLGIWHTATSAAL